MDQLLDMIQSGHEQAVTTAKFMKLSATKSIVAVETVDDDETVDEEEDEFGEEHRGARTSRNNSNAGMHNYTD